MNQIENHSQGLPDFATLLWRGFRRTCPRCGRGLMFRRFLKLNTACQHCGLEMGDIRADDFPPYLTIVVVGHIVVPGILLMEKALQPATFTQLVIWLPITGVLTLWFLPRLKGVVVAWMLHLGLRGDETQ